MVAQLSRAEVWLLSEGEERQIEGRETEEKNYNNGERMKDRQNRQGIALKIDWKWSRYIFEKWLIRWIWVHRARAQTCTVWAICPWWAFQSKGITSQKHNYWKPFGFTRHQINSLINRPPCTTLSSGLLSFLNVNLCYLNLPFYCKSSFEFGSMHKMVTEFTTFWIDTLVAAFLIATKNFKIHLRGVQC